LIRYPRYRKGPLAGGPFKLFLALSLFRYDVVVGILAPEYEFAHRRERYGDQGI